MQDQQATTVVMGQSVRSRLEEILRGSLITRVMRETKSIDVLVVGGE
ncbi:MAG TPA: universal stress protein [Armatimonadota bacterium]